MRQDNPPDKSTKTSFKSVVPRCSGVREFLLWKELARKAPPSKAVGFCEDCLPSFKAKHMKNLTCENPLVVFERNQSKHIDGCLPKLEEDVLEIIQQAA